MYRLSMTWPRLALVVFSRGAALSTITLRGDLADLQLNVQRWPVAARPSVNALRWYFWNPAASTLSVYVPGGNAVSTYRPRRVGLGAAFRIAVNVFHETVAAGTAAFDESVTTPRTVAVDVWPSRIAGRQLASTSHSRNLRVTINWNLQASPLGSVKLHWR